jgi:predicted O-methyltransferase YrrM
MINDILKQLTPPLLLTFYRRMRNRKNFPERRFILPQVMLYELFQGPWPISIVVDKLLFRGNEDTMTLPMRELLAIAVICKKSQPKRIFEFGTYTGVSTLVMAMNTPEESRIFTLDIDPASRDNHEHGMGIGGFAPFELGQSYKNTEYEGKITQLLGNSLTFDFKDLMSTIDLVFVDADHSYRFVTADSENAFKLIRPGGIIIWDDYVWHDDYPICSGVARSLHELQGLKQLYWIAGTRFAVYIDNFKDSNQ